MNLSGSKVKVGNYDKRMKYYFAPKTYTIKGVSGTVYTITPQKNGSDNDWKRLYCKYIYKHTYDNSVEPTDNWTDGVHTNGTSTSTLMTIQLNLLTTGPTVFTLMVLSLATSSRR